MKNQVSNFTEFRKYYLSEYELYDGECFITFNLVGVDLDRNEIQVAVSDRGRISVVTYDLMTDNGVIIEKDGKRLINRKTLDGFMKYACDEARKQAEKGKNSACIQDSVVYGWAIHYFEEDSLEGVLYNEDGTEHKPAPIVKQSAPVTPVPTPKPASKPQMSLFDLMTEQEKPAEPVQEKPKDELKPARQALSPIPDANSDEEDNGISDEELQEVFI